MKSQAVISIVRMLGEVNVATAISVIAGIVCILLFLTEIHMDYIITLLGFLAFALLLGSILVLGGLAIWNAIKQHWIDD